MGVQVTPIPTEVVSDSLPFPFPVLFYSHSRGIPMGFPVPLGIPFQCTSLIGGGGGGKFKGVDLGVEGSTP